MRRAWDKHLGDAALFRIIAAVGVVTLVALAVAPHFILPEEDAVILFQYSRNLAHTGAITYITHGPHAEGATDFAWMVLLAAGIKLQVPPFWAAAAVNVASLLWLPWLLAKIAGERLRLPFALFVVGVFGLLPQVAAAALGFSVLPFACLLALTVLCFKRSNDVFLALTCLLLCLFRPDGVVFAMPLLLSALILREGRVRRLLVYVSAFAVPGAAYFAWRWWYFGEALPLPFLVKADAQRWLGLVVTNSAQHGAFLCVFAFALVWLALRGRERVGGVTRAIVLSVLLLPCVFYFAMRLDQNAGHRFFVYLPLGMAVVLAAEWPRVRARRALLLRAGCVLWLVFVCRMWGNALEAGREAQFDNRVAIAQGLQSLPHGSLLTTEAGFVPYESDWTAYDAWGLNTAAFAKRLLQPADVAALRPEAILLYAGGDRACTVGSGWQTPYATRTWQHMTRNLVAGIDPAQYELWYTPYASMRLRRERGVQDWQGDQECWFVRRDAAQRAGIEADLRAHGARTEAEYAALQGSSGEAERVEHPSMFRIILRAPYRAWKRLSD